MTSHYFRISLLLTLIAAWTATPLYAQTLSSFGGVVIGMDGNPVGQVLLKAHSDGGDGIAKDFTTQSDDKGKYFFENVPLGEYQLSAQVNGEAWSTVHASATKTFSTTVRVESTAETLRFLDSLPRVSTRSDVGAFTTFFSQTGLRYVDNVPTVDITGPGKILISDTRVIRFDILILKSVFNVRGRVFRPSDIAIPPAKIIIRGILPSLSGIVDMDRDGSFVFPSIPPGQYVVQMIPNLGIPAVPLTVADKDVGIIELGPAATGVPVGGGIISSDLARYGDRFPDWIYLDHDGLIGSASSSGGKAQLLTAAFSNQTQAESFPSIAWNIADLPIAPVDRDGNFQFLSVSPGQYTVRTVPDMGIANTTITVAGRKLNDVLVGGGVRVRGEVVPLNFGTRPPDAVNLTLLGVTQGASVSAAIGENGLFEFPKVGPGIYQVKLDGKIQSKPAEIEVGEQDGFIRLETPFGSWLKGRVVFSGTGKSLPPDSLSSIHVTMTNGYESPLDSDGTFRLKSNDGEYEIYLRDLPEGCVVKSILYGSDEVLHATMKVDASAVPRDIQVMLEYTPPVLSTVSPQ